MPKSSKDVTNLFRSLAPDNAAFQPSVNASVREAEQRWPLLKTTPPKKFDLTPELSDEERQHWLSVKRTKPENRKHQALTVSSSVSKDKLAESLQKMAGSKVKTKASGSRVKATEKTTTQAKAIPQTHVNVANKNITEIKKSVELNKIVEVKPGIEVNEIGVTNKAVANKKMVMSMPSIRDAVINEGKSLRGIFDRLKSRKLASHTPEPVVIKSSVLSKLSKR